MGMSERMEIFSGMSDASCVPQVLDEEGEMAKQYDFVSVEQPLYR
jgi:hypothetical protein